MMSHLCCQYFRLTFELSRDCFYVGQSMLITNSSRTHGNWGRVGWVMISLPANDALGEIWGLSVYLIFRCMQTSVNFDRTNFWQHNALPT